MISCNHVCCNDRIMWSRFLHIIKGCSIFDKILKTYTILVFLIIIIVVLSVLKQVWSKNNVSMNFRGDKMLNVNSVLGRPKGSKGF